MVLEGTHVAETLDETTSYETANAFSGLGFPAQTLQEGAGPASATEATQAYVQAYHEAVAGYRKRHEAVERYSALLHR